jgi:3-hydroxyacyl-CoA dehydrogenase
MSRNICIAGSGKIALDAGLYFLTRGNAVSWVSHSEDCIARLQWRVDKSVHRFMKHAGGAARRISASFFMYGELERESFEVIFECSRESPEVKQGVFADIVRHADPHAIFLSASSSILPSEIGAACCGLHVFYPMELSGVAEVIVPHDAPAATREAVFAFCKDNRIACIVENERNAFVVNRLLLPLQNEVFLGVASGICSDDVNAASASALVPMGQYDLVRSVGPLVVASAVRNYRSRMNAACSALFDPLSQGLANTAACGGKSTEGRRLQPRERDELTTTLYYLFINTCLEFLERKEIHAADLDLVLDSVFGAELSFTRALAKEEKPVITRVLETALRNGGKEYFKPSKLLLPD